MSLINYHPGLPPSRPKSPGRSAWRITKWWYEWREATHNIRWRKWYFGKYLKSDAWQLKRNYILARDGKRCRLCGATDRLQVHHLPGAYKRAGFEKASDLVTLCKTCHGREHGRLE